MKQLIVRLDGSVEIPPLLSPPVIDLEAPSPVQLRPRSFEFSRHRILYVSPCALRRRKRLQKQVPKKGP
jgi:hypothetical protein